MPLEYRNLGGFFGAACALIAGTMLLIAASTHVAVAADDEDDDWYDVKIMRKVLQGIGLRRDGAAIDYRERSPLVVPPSRDLPAPDTNAAPNNPAWPVDPDIKRRKEEAAARRKPGRAKESFIEDDARPLTPAELAKGRNPRGAKEGYSTDPNSEARPYSPAALGAKSVFSWDGLFGSNKEESAPFTGEPARGSLTQPPAGYQTPSPNQPYGVGPNRGDRKAATWEERMEDRR
jgi:hypothetical protein